MNLDDVLEPAGWFALSDPVMGGVSHGALVREGGVAVFRGVVSLANGGGFASVRSAQGDYDLARFTGLALRVRGDGKRYGLRLRTSAAFASAQQRGAPFIDGVTFQATFVTEPGAALALALPWAEFRPVFRGRPVPGHPPLDPAQVRTFGLLIGERQAGPFRLEIESLAAF